MTTLRPPETDLTRFYALFPQPALARDLFTVTESHRVDARLRRTYPGIRRDMAVIRAATLERRPDPAGLPDAQAVVELLLQHSLGAEGDLGADLAPALRPVAARARLALDAVLDEDTEVADSARVAAELYAIIDDGTRDPRRWAPEEPEGAPADQSQGAEGGEGGAEAQPGPGGEDYESLELPPFMTPVLEEMVRQQREAGRDGQGRQEEAEAPRPPEDPFADHVQTMSTAEVAEGPRQESEDAAQTLTRSEADQAPAPAPGQSADRRTDDAEGGGETPEATGLAEVPHVDAEREESDLGEQVFHYDEWDHKIEDYRPAWCTLREERATRAQEGFVAATFHEFGGIVSQIRRNFQLMRPERLRKMRYQTEGDDLDTDGLVEYVVDRRARIAPSGRVYVKRDKKDRDVTTAFLVDMSSSTDRKIDGRKRIIDIEKEALLLMCEALEAIRDEYAIYGFSGSGRDDCQFYVVKELGDRYDDRVKSRIGGIYGRQKTRMGPALRHATKRLMGVDSNIKLLILLTDGKPYDSDTYQDNAYAQEDTKVALREARREKIHLFCVTVDREAADYLPHMYSDANFVIIDDVRTLPQKLPQLYRRLTT
jgi:nitric oxide reductase activation protein